MKRTELKRGKPMARAAKIGVLGAAAKQSAEKCRLPSEKKPAKRSTLKTKERAVTQAEKEYWDRLAALGCAACMREGVFEPDVSIHHVDGRTKPGCHMLVLPLCASHHQDGTGKNPHYIAVHPWKTRFEAKFGTQKELMSHCAVLLEWRK